MRRGVMEKRVGVRVRRESGSGDACNDSDCRWATKVGEKLKKKHRLGGATRRETVKDEKLRGETEGKRFGA